MICGLQLLRPASTCTKPLYYTLNSTLGGERHYTFVWNGAMGHDTDLVITMTETAASAGRMALPLHCVLEDLKTAARELFTPAFTEVFEKTPQPLFQPIYD